MFTSFFLSAHHLRGTLSLIKATKDKRQSQAPPAKRAELPSVERIVAAFLLLETEAQSVAMAPKSQGCGTNKAKNGMMALANTGAHRQFLRLIEREIRALKSKSHRQLRYRLAEYLNDVAGRDPQLLAEIGHALSSALLIV